MPSDQSPRVSLLIVAKCACETAAECVDKVLAEPTTKQMPIEEELRMEELWSAIAAAHKRLGVQLRKFEGRKRRTRI